MPGEKEGWRPGLSGSVGQSWGLPAACGRRLPSLLGCKDPLFRSSSKAQETLHAKSLAFGVSTVQRREALSPLWSCSCLLLQAALRAGDETLFCPWAVSSAPQPCLPCPLPTPCSQGGVFQPANLVLPTPTCSPFPVRSELTNSALLVPLCSTALSRQMP